MIYFVCDGNYGVKNFLVGMWNGVVWDVLEGKVDIVIDFMINEVCLEVIDFFLCWMYVGFVLFVFVGE